MVRQLHEKVVRLDADLAFTPSQMVALLKHFSRNSGNAVLVMAIKLMDPSTTTKTDLPQVQNQLELALPSDTKMLQLHDSTGEQGPRQSISAYTRQLPRPPSWSQSTPRTSLNRSERPKNNKQLAPNHNNNNNKIRTPRVLHIVDLGGRFNRINLII